MTDTIENQSGPGPNHQRDHWSEMLNRKIESTPLPGDAKSAALPGVGIAYTSMPEINEGTATPETTTTTVSESKTSFPETTTTTSRPETTTTTTLKQMIPTTTQPTPETTTTMPQATANDLPRTM